MDSDTESEGEHAMPSASASNAEFVLRQPQALSDLSVAEAIAILVDTAPRATSLGSDSELHENVVAASSSLNRFLDSMLQGDAMQKQDICVLFDVLISLLYAEFLFALFTHRRAVYSLLRSLGDTSSISVPWTDVLLLKLCRVVANVSSGYTQSSAPTQLLDAQALWAVRQLPQILQDLTTAIYSAYASPGMRKLALQLVFGAYIVRPSMARDAEPPCVPFHSTDIEGIAQFYGDLTIRRAGGLGEDEELSCAMVTVLCTTFALKQADNSSSPASRPYFSSLVFGCLHELFDTGRLDLFSSGSLGPAQLLLLSWGDVLPWCWRACTDPRSADMPLVSLLTALWLLQQSREDTNELWKNATLDLLVRDLSLSATHILQLLYRVGEALNDEWVNVEAVARLARLVCWSMAQLSDPLVEGHIVFFPDAALHLCTIFLHYVSGGTAASDVAESALQALLHAAPSDVCVVAERLAEGHDFPSTFDRAITSMRKSLSQRGDIRSVQLLLAFVTTFGHRGTRLPCYKSSLTMLSSAVSDNVCAGLENSRSLAVSLAVAAPHLGVGGRALSEEEVLCLLYPEQTQNTGVSPTLDLLCAAAVSSYILSGNTALQTMSSLLKAEIWDALRDAVALTIERRFVGEDEALAVLVAPLIGSALSRLSACGDAVFAEHAIESSWTSSLQSQLAALLRSDIQHHDHVQAALSTRIAPAGKALLDLAMPENGNHVNEGSQTGCATQLVFHSFAGCVFIVPVLAC